MAHASVTWPMLCGACAPIEESLAISYVIAQLRDIKTSLTRHFGGRGMTAHRPVSGILGWSAPSIGHPAGSRRTDRPGGPMTLVAQPWNNPWHGRAAGAAIRRTLEDGCLGPPSGVRRAGRRHCGPHRDVVGIYAVGPGRRGVHLARRRSRHVGGVLLAPARASRATTWVLVDEVHAHPRHGPRPVVGPAVLTAPPFAAASAVRQSPVLSTRPGCTSAERARMVPHNSGYTGDPPPGLGSGGSSPGASPTRR